MHLKQTCRSSPWDPNQSDPIPLLSVRGCNWSLTPQSLSCFINAPLLLHYCCVTAALLLRYYYCITTTALLHYSLVISIMFNESLLLVIYYQRLPNTQNYYCSYTFENPSIFRKPIELLLPVTSQLLVHKYPYNTLFGQ